jgi:hypothetical protein
MNFLTDPPEEGSTLRPINVLVYEWIGGKYACLDLIRVFPFVGLTTRDFIIRKPPLRLLQAK